MRILFDHGTPVPLRRFLSAHTVVTAFELNWTELDNGALLKAAELEFDALVTTDQKPTLSAKSVWTTFGDPGVADDQLA